MTAQSDRRDRSKGAQPEEADKALLEAEPNWDRAAEIAKRLLSTPPDRQAAGKAVAPKNAIKPNTNKFD